ncbi:MAG TPA: putative DNA-binding domain-containing protein, partial [Usitatibacter sp.]|nr:putative DNA-binding domain-containing protein [Usitatibacter sp.]
MPSLHDAQRALQRAILADAPVAEGMLSAGSRPGIYRHAYRARLAGALAANYPALAAALGAAAFRELAERYARMHPSRRYSIRWHGDRLAEALDDERLADLARMEWALGIAFDAPDET